LSITSPSDAAKIAPSIRQQSRAVCQRYNAGAFEGGHLGFHAVLTFGYPELVNRWIGISPQAIDISNRMPSLTPSTIRISGSAEPMQRIRRWRGLGIAHNVNLFARWLSATEVTGSPYSFDIVMVDLTRASEAVVTSREFRRAFLTEGQDAFAKIIRWRATGCSNGLRVRLHSITRRPRCH